jgi:hypothetical protein
VEGGIGAYLLGSRGAASGIVPPAGFYSGVDFVFLQGDVDGLSVAGLPIRADSKLDLALAKVSLTNVFDATLWGGTPALNINIPYVLNAGLSFTTVDPPIAGVQISDETSGIGDIAITPMVGWHSENWHWSAALTVFAPTGAYDTASVNVSERSIDALNVGKNVWSAQPVFAATYLDQESGLEVSGAASMLFSQKNDATDYQTAPAVMFEGAVMQHLPSGLALGLTGYAYQQVSDDSGAGAEATRIALDADSLRARVYGAGPVVTFSGGTLFGGNTSFKLKYITEFAGKRRFESDMVWLNMTVAF